MKLFEELLIDEEGHIDFLETQLELLGKLGAEKYGQLNAAFRPTKPSNASEPFKIYRFQLCEIPGLSGDFSFPG
jgi:hypothetical protein